MSPIVFENRFYVLLGPGSAWSRRSRSYSRVASARTSTRCGSTWTRRCGARWRRAARGTRWRRVAACSLPHTPLSWRADTRSCSASCGRCYTAPRYTTLQAVRNASLKPVMIIKRCYSDDCTRARHCMTFPFIMFKITFEFLASPYIECPRFSPV